MGRTETGSTSKGIPSYYYF